MGWESCGVFPAGADGTDINSVDANNERSLIAASDDFGSLTVYRFPCLNNKQDCRRLSGHAEHVVRVRFYEELPEQEGDEGYERLITAGGMDRTYIQWKAVPVPVYEDDGGVINYQ